MFKKHARLTSSSLQNAESIMQIYDRIGLDVFTPGPYDLLNGLKFFDSYVPDNYTIVSSNIYSSETGKPAFQQAKQLRVAEVVVTVLGLTGMGEKRAKDYFYEDKATVLQELIKQYRERTDFFILLSSFSLPENKALAAQFPDLSVIISADNRLTSISPLQVNNSLIVQTVNRGKYLGSIHIQPGQSSAWGQDYTSTIRAKVKSLNTLQYQLKLHQHQSHKERKDSVESLHQNIAIAEKELAAVKKAKERDDTLYSQYVTRNHKLGKGIQENKDIEMLIKKLLRK